MAAGDGDSMGSVIDRLVVRISEYDQGKLLEPTFDNRLNILSAQRRHSQHWPFGMDLGARIVMDFDQDWFLAQLEILIPPNHWQEELFQQPHPKQWGTLALNAMPVQRISSPLRPAVLKHPEASQILIQWGPAQPSQSIRIAPQLVALLADTLWVGLFIEGF